MFKLIGIIFSLIVFALIIGIAVIGSLLRSVFGFGQQGRTGQDPRQPSRGWQGKQPNNDTHIHSSDSNRNPKKFYDKSEGEYVDFEEVD